VTLFVFGGVVIAVFLEVAHLACAPDALGHLDTAARREVEMLGLQALEGDGRNAMLRHAVRLLMRSVRTMNI